jgi:hypothetical protein
MTRCNVLLAVLIALAGAGVALWWFQNFERVAREVTGPMRGKARYNALYALERALAAQGHAVESQPRLDLGTEALAPGDLIVLANDVRTLTPDQAQGLLDWVESGGHLVFGLPQGAEGRSGDLLDALGVWVIEHFQCASWKAATDAAAVQRCTSVSFQVEDDAVAEYALLWPDDDAGYVLGRRSWGQGDWTVAADLDFLRNTELDDPGRAELAWQVLAPALGHGRVLLVYAADVPPLHVLIVRHGWPIVLPLLLALLAWLWARGPRLGPPLAVSAGARRALLEHVEAAGEFAFRRGRGVALHAAVRRALLRRWQSRDPALSALEGPALVHALAERSGRDAEHVRHALEPFDLNRDDRFLAAIRTLTELKPKP